VRLSDFDYTLPEELIALYPADPRSSARLLVAENGETRLAHVADLPAALRDGDVLVFNDTRVIPARLYGQRIRGDVSAKVEITLIADQGDEIWRAMAKPARKLSPGDHVAFGPHLNAEVISREGAEAQLRFSHDQTDFMTALAKAGVMPLPPYIAARRPPEAQDHDSYQSVFAARDGAIAAPTASLHFDAALVAALDAAGITRETVTLHVGIGTFLPVTVDDISDHQMHAEWGEIDAATAARLNAAKEEGRRVIAVGTTALRLLETAAASGRIGEWSGETDIFITPGYEFRAIDGLMTNFHLPQSTLLMLVSALMGMERMKDIYQLAIKEQMRFFSYGDASLLIPAKAQKTTV